jgi:EpsD family peptidyl-prolyl cis-trans isomerase
MCFRVQAASDWLACSERYDAKVCASNLIDPTKECTMTKKYIAPSVLISIVFATTMGGCGNKEGDKAATQVVAKVNGAEISLHQVNHFLSKAGNVPADQLEKARKGVVDRLVDQELLAAKAVEEKLDRTPETLMAMDLARREILARARIEQVLAAAPKLSPADVTRYYATHPELFSDRQIYNLQEITFPPQKEGIAEVQALVDKGASMNEIQEFLRSRNVQFGTNAGVRAAEQLPMDLVKALHGTKEGGTLLSNSPQGTTVVKVLGLRKVPVDETAARPAIQKFLFNQRLAEVTANELKTLKAAAKIEFVGTLTDLPKPDAAPRQSPTAAAAPLPPLPQLDQMPLTPGQAAR